MPKSIFEIAPMDPIVSEYSVDGTDVVMRRDRQNHYTPVRLGMMREVGSFVQSTVASSAS